MIMAKPGDRRSSDERKEKLRQYWADPQRRLAHGELTRARMATPEVRQKIANSNAAAWASPEKRQSHAALMRERMEEPAVRLKISERTKLASKATHDRRLTALIDAWNGASRRARHEFLDLIDRPSSGKRHGRVSNIPPLKSNPD